MVAAQLRATQTSATLVDEVAAATIGAVALSTAIAAGTLTAAQKKNTPGRIARYLRDLNVFFFEAFSCTFVNSAALRPTLKQKEHEKK